MTTLNFRENNFDIILFIAALQVVFMHGYEHFGFASKTRIIQFLEFFQVYQ